VGVIFFVRGTGAVVVVVVVVVGGGLYLVALLVVGVGVGRAHVNTSARAKAEVGGLGGECICYSLHHVCDRPTVREEVVSLTACNLYHDQLFWGA
jgi:hypothetical protein